MSCTSRTVTRTTLRTTTARHSRGHRSSEKAAAAAGSSSRTTKRPSRRSSSEPAVRAQSSPSRRTIRSTRSPSVGIETKPFYLRKRRPVQGGPAARQLRVPRRLRRPAGSACQRAAQAGWRGGALPHQRRQGEEGRHATSGTGARSTTASPSVYYHVLSGTVKGAAEGDSVEVSFEQSGGPRARATRSPTRSRRSPKNRVLVVAAEDYTGASPVQASRPSLPDLLPRRARRERVGADVYDVDANGRRAPDALGVLFALRRGRLVHGRRHWSRVSLAGARRTSRVSPSTSCTSSATS